jgi:hypothetical protein
MAVLGAIRMKMNSRAMVFFLASLCVPTVAAAEEVAADNPTVAMVLAERLPQTKVGDCDYSENASLNYKRTEIHFSENGEISISGFAIDGSHWKASINVSPAAGCEIWSAELAQGRPPALIIMAWNLDSSGGWQTALDLILFNDQGMPMPWRALSFFDVDAKGVQEIVRLPGAANASILVPVREGERTDGFAYAYDLYDVVEDRLRRVTDVRYGVKWPFIPNKRQDLETSTIGQLTSLSKKTSPAENAEILVEVDMLHERLSTFNSIATPEPRRIISLARHPGDNNLQLEIEDGPTVGFPEILMEDTSDSSRSMNFQPDEDDVRKAISNPKKTLFIGRGCMDRSCNPLIMKIVSQ